MGKINYLGDVRVHDAEDGLIAEVAVDPDGNYAFRRRLDRRIQAGTRPPKANPVETPAAA